MANLPTVSQKTITALDEAASAGQLTTSTAGGQFARALATANAVNTLRDLLTPDVMKNVMQLQNTSLGFMTDRRDAPYSMDVVRDCLIEAVLQGVSPVGNEFNIISSRCYITKNGMRRKLSNIDGLSYTITPGIPKLAEKGAVIVMSIDWTYQGQTNHKDLAIPVRVNAGMGTDAIIGKATRKASAWLYDAITGTSVNEGDVSDGDTITVEAKSVTSPIETDTHVEDVPADGTLPM
jgi:hypothetical protein